MFEWVNFLTVPEFKKYDVVYANYNFVKYGEKYTILIYNTTLFKS